MGLEVPLVFFACKFDDNRDGAISSPDMCFEGNLSREWVWTAMGFVRRLSGVEAQEVVRCWWWHAAENCIVVAEGELQHNGVFSGGRAGLPAPGDCAPSRRSPLKAR